ETDSDGFEVERYEGPGIDYLNTDLFTRELSRCLLRANSHQLGSDDRHVCSLAYDRGLPEGHDLGFPREVSFVVQHGLVLEVEHRILVIHGGAQQPVRVPR